MDFTKQIHQLGSSVLDEDKGIFARIRNFYWSLEDKYVHWPRLIPKHERPGSLPSRDFLSDNQIGAYTWEDWRRDMKKKYPIRFFLEYDVHYWCSVNIVRHVKNARYFLVSHTIRRYHMLDTRSPQNGYKYGYIDRSEQIFFAAFACLRDYVELEDPWRMVDWDWNEDHKAAAAEIKALYAWWTTGRAAKREAAYAMPCESREERAAHYKATDALEAEDEEMLKRLIAVRKWLWT